MKFAFLTYGLSSNNIHLMPWRYILEIAKGLIRLGHSATIVSDASKSSINNFPLDLPLVNNVQGSFSKRNPLYLQNIGDIDPDVIYFPVARRSAFVNYMTYIKNIPHIAYFPSCWYDFSLTLRVLGQIPALQGLVYAVESIVPGKLLVRFLKRRKVKAVATMTEYTARKFIQSGWPDSAVSVLPPGLDNDMDCGLSSEVFKKYMPRMREKKCVIFMGPSTAIRGIYVLLQAFDHAATLAKDIMLVCLIRHDSHTEWTRLKSTVEVSKNADRILVVEERLNKNDLTAFIYGSRAVVLPFMLIPSEIPLTILETLKLHKPIIISKTGGTSDFLGKAGISVPPNDVKSLSKAILETCCNEELYSRTLKEVRQLIKNHPSWQTVASTYLHFTEKILSLS